MILLIRIFLICLIIYLIFRSFSKYSEESEGPVKNPEHRKNDSIPVKKVSKKVGEYVEYEEIDKGRK